jgi:hypothetical protein
MSAAATDYFTEVGNPGTATTLAAPGHSIAGSAINITSSSNWPTSSGAIFAMDTYDVSTGKRVPGSYTEWEGVIGTNAISGMILRYGTDQNYSAGSTTRVYIPVSSSRENRMAQGILLHANQDGSLKTAAVQAALGLTNLNGYTPVGFNPNTVTYNGGRYYTCVFNGVDLTTFLSPGMRLQFTRTAAAPNQCTSLNGTSQYFVKTTPNKLSFTDDFVVSAWIKLAAYPSSTGIIVSRYNGTSGWDFGVDSAGRIFLQGKNGGSGNVSNVTSNQSVPLNKWIHVTAQLDMSAFTATTTTSYVMFDGVDISATVARAGTNPTALIQAGNLEIGGENTGTQLFTGKIAQVAVFSAKVTQATMRTYVSQGLAGSETSLDTAFSLSNSVNDLNATTPNNLAVGGGSAVATNADSPFGGQGNGSISTTLEYGELVDLTFSTNTTITVRVPDVNNIPTSGGIAATVYSSNVTPYGWPGISNVLASSLIGASFSTTSTSAAQVSGLSATVTIPQGGRRVRITVFARDMYNSAGAAQVFVTLWDGTVGSGTQIASVTANSSSSASAAICQAVVTPSAGSKTYNAALHTSNAANGANLEAGPTFPAFILVEVI